MFFIYLKNYNSLYQRKSKQKKTRQMAKSHELPIINNLRPIIAFKKV